MKIQFWSVGKANEPYVSEGVRDFTARINRYFKAEWILLAPPKNSASLSESELLKREGAQVLELLGRDDYLIALEETGTMLSSIALAKLLQTRANESTRNLIFLIGGAFGLDEAVLKRADFKWSLSSLVFPHQLVRLILAEQVYRACTIIRNEKYHHK